MRFKDACTGIKLMRPFDPALDLASVNVLLFYCNFLKWGIDSSLLKIC